jgi:hypothetical protein
VTYVKTLALALDYWSASVFFNQKDITISSLCWMLDQGKEAPLKLSRCQRWALSKIGPWLDRHWPNHRARARYSDITRLKNALDMLT